MSMFKRGYKFYFHVWYIYIYNVVKMVIIHKKIVTFGYKQVV